ncbi:ankyrin repeat protein [Trichoderma virens Gv29-8]|uniref:Ankyrin repeat protein n=1 Tax=Hypocrea virens (strain Gv29-8 / FGSC 10586) TaxID=413071 RepID=G9MJG0_HYPVG|nr:ankyrin repeat protein [Trichoderma virens Gv29-8]EHK25623.1 ankyrin repeat protein [Trichoderma virens Gv29-8]
MHPYSHLYGLELTKIESVITVHGLRDDYGTAWKLNKKEHWLGTWLFEDVPIRQLDFVYAIDDSARIFKRGGIKAEAQDLMREYLEKRRNLPDTEIDRPIVWVCHDIGGSIVKEVLIEATRATKKEDYDDVETWQQIKDTRRRIATLTTAFISLDCPHRPRPMERLEEEIHGLMMLPGPEINSGLMRKIKIMAHQVNRTNIQFLETNFFSRIVNINVCYFMNIDEQENSKPTSNHMTMPALEPDKTLGGIDDQHVTGDEIRHSITSNSQSVMDPSSITIESPAVPFNRYTLTLNNMFELYWRYAQVGINHLELMTGEKFSRKIWTRYHDMLFNQHYYSLKPNTSLIHGQITLLSMMPPRKMPTTHMYREVKGEQKLPVLKWIADQVTYKNFNESHGPQVLHIECTAGDRPHASTLSQYFYSMQELSSWETSEFGNKTCFYFEFDNFDVRYNTIQSMLITFINEIAWRFWHNPKDAPTIRRVFENLSYHHNWSLADLFMLFTEVRKCPSVRGFTLILGCWDNCVQEERKWFLSKVLEQHRRSDLDYRLVVTTSGSEEFLKENIPKSQVLSLNNCPVSIQGYALDDKYPPSGLRPLLEDLFQERPALKNIGETLEKVIDECQGTPYLGYIILKWVARFGRKGLASDIATAVEQLRPITPDHILATIIEKLSPKKQKLARVIYRWVKYAMEPLTIEALGHAVASSMPLDFPLLVDVDCEGLLEKLDKLFCGIIILDGREIKFSHESFYSCSAFSELGCDNKASGHGELAKACLNYLLREEVLHNQYSKFSTENHGGGLDKDLLFLPRDDLLDYAVRTWATHYQLSDQYRPVDLALQFLQNKQARDKWTEAHYLLSNPFTRIHRSYISPLPLMAALGLEDIVSRQIEEDKDSKWFQEDCWLSITEAGRAGHTAVLRKLLNLVQAQERWLQDAIYWSTFSGNENVMAVLLEKVNSLNSFSFPSSILPLASAAGLEDLVSAILKQSDHNLAEPNPKIGNQTVLHGAIYWGRKIITRLLLDSGAEMNVQDDEGESPLQLSIKMGDPEIVQLILERQENISDDSKRGLSLINATITAGEFAALRCILLAGADCNTGESEASSDELRYPIIHAATYKRIGCLRLLLENGADACIESEEGSLLYILSAIPQAIDICHTLLQKGALPHQCYLNKEMLLNRALRANNRRLIELLIEKGAQLDTTDTYRRAGRMTPLSFATTNCSFETLKFLLDKGADPNYVPDGGESTLFVAVFRRCDSAKIELLLKRGADIHWKRWDGWTPLHAAYDTPDILLLLLEHGSDVNAKAEEGTILMMASRWNCPETVRLLVSRKIPSVDLNAKLDWDKDDSDYGKTALDLAIQNGHCECANILLEAGVKIDVNSVAIKHIMGAVTDKNSEEEALKLINHCLQRGMKLDGTDEMDKTALHYITRSTPTSLIRFLIDWGCQPHAVDSDGLTPLAIAVRNNNIEVVKHLLNRGVRADVGAPGSGDILHQALREKHRDPGDIITMLKALIDAGASPLQRSPNSEESLLDIVMRDFEGSSLRKIYPFLVRKMGSGINMKGGQGVYPIIMAAKRREWELVESLIRHKADCSVADSLGRRPVHFIAAMYSDEDLVRLISKSGTDMQAPDSFGRTPLHLVAGFGYRYTLRALVSTLPKEFDVNVKDADGWTPLMWACKLDASNWGVVEDLVEMYNADISVTSTDGQWSPLKLACFSDMEPETQELLKPLGGSGEGNSRDLDTYSGIMFEGWRCDSCFLFNLCFKCYPRRSEMHEVGHDFEEYRSPSVAGTEKAAELEVDHVSGHNSQEEEEEEDDEGEDDIEDEDEDDYDDDNNEDEEEDVDGGGDGDGDDI